MTYLRILIYHIVLILRSKFHLCCSSQYQVIGRAILGALRRPDTT
jgi:hypothetical protein